MSRRALDTDTAARWATGLFKDRNRTIYTLLIILALLFPSIADVSTGGSGNHLVSTAADAGVYVLLAMGLNIVVGFAGLLDLGYAAFFAIGAYTYALLASGQLSGSPLHHEFHLPFWLLLRSSGSSFRGTGSVSERSFLASSSSWVPGHQSGTGPVASTASRQSTRPNCRPSSRDPGWERRSRWSRHSTSVIRVGPRWTITF